MDAEPLDNPIATEEAPARIRSLSGNQVIRRHRVIRFLSHRTSHVH